MFDLDGTLVDSAPDLAAAIDKTLLCWGVRCGYRTGA
jgi:phosphoglycolate phosphatase-like HAD superfamily hydrolase